MKVLVTGAAGYLGQGIVSALCDLGAEVIASDFNTDIVDSRAKKLSGNIFEADNPYIHSGKPDVVLHLAWQDGFVHSSDAHFNNLPLHINFIKSCIEDGAKEICVMGTMHEIGFYEGGIDENTPCNPINFYGIAKNALRHATEVICDAAKVNLRWLRGYYIVGNPQYGNSIFSKIYAAEKEGKETFPFTSGKNQYDFLDYDEFCRQVAAATVQNSVNGIINICSGKPESLASRVERFIKDNNYGIKLQYGAFPDRPYDSKAVWGDDTKIKQILDSQNK